VPRTPKTPNRRDLLDTKLSELTTLIREISPQARVEISFESFEDEDAHIRIYPPSSVQPEEASRIDLKLGEQCNNVLSETGLFIIGAVCD
jgi:hypothetical protein